MPSHCKTRLKIVRLSPRNSFKPLVTWHKLYKKYLHDNIMHTQFTKTTHKCIMISYTRVTWMVQKVSACVLWVFPVHLSRLPPSEKLGDESLSGIPGTRCVPQASVFTKLSSNIRALYPESFFLL